MLLALLLVLDVVGVGRLSPADGVLLLLLGEDGASLVLLERVLREPGKTGLAPCSPCERHRDLGQVLVSCTRRGDPLAKAGLARRGLEGERGVPVEVLEHRVVDLALCELSLFDLAIELRVVPHPVRGGGDIPLRRHVPGTTRRIQNCHICMILLGELFFPVGVNLWI